jgi:hypothetical protein
VQTDELFVFFEHIRNSIPFHRPKFFSAENERVHFPQPEPHQAVFEEIEMDVSSEAKPRHDRAMQRQMHALRIRCAYRHLLDRYDYQIFGVHERSPFMESCDTLPHFSGKARAGKIASPALNAPAVKINNGIRHFLVPFHQQTT